MHSRHHLVLPSCCTLLAMALLVQLPSESSIAETPSLASMSLQPGDVPGFSPIDPSTETFQDPNDQGFDQAFIQSAGTSPLLSLFDSSSSSDAVVSQVYGQGQNDFGSPELSAATAVFSNGSVTDAESAFTTLKSSAFRACWSSTSDSLNASQGITTPQSPSNVSALSTPALGSESAGFAINVNYSVEGTPFSGQLGVTVIQAGSILVVLLTLAYGQDFPDSTRLSIARQLSNRMGGTSQPPSGASCPNVAIYGVRGSSQDYLASETGMGPETYAVAQEIRRRLPPNWTIEDIGVPYPASSPIEAIFNASTEDLSPYNHSVSSGVSLLLHGRSDFTTPGGLLDRCPDTAVVLAGISQGAQVITTALSQDSGSSTLEKRVAAVILLASPVRLKGQSINIGAQNEDGVLANPASSQPGRRAAIVPTALRDRTRSYCLQDDPVCDNTNVALLLPVLPPPNNIVNHRTDIHTSYAKSLFTLQAADFAVRQIRAAEHQTPPVNGYSPAPTDYVALGDSYTSWGGHKRLLQRNNERR